MLSGIYSLTCVANGRVYIGSSQDVMTRWRWHVRMLSTGRHYNCRLQSAWKKYGAESFSFAILSLCKPEQLIKAEQIFIDIFSATQTGFNLCPIAASPRGRKASVLTRAKMSESRKGRRPPSYPQMLDGFNRWKAAHPEDLMKNLARGHAAKLGRKWSPEHRAKAMAAKKPLSAEASRSISLASASRRHTDEAKEKMSKASKARWENYRARNGVGRLSGVCS